MIDDRIKFKMYYEISTQICTSKHFSNEFACVCVYVCGFYDCALDHGETTIEIVCPRIELI